MDEEPVELTEAVAALRQQLGGALRTGDDEEVRFRLGPVELEFKLAGGVAVIKVGAARVLEWKHLDQYSNWASAGQQLRPYRGDLRAGATMES